MGSLFYLEIDAWWNMSKNLKLFTIQSLKIGRNLYLLGSLFLPLKQKCMGYGFLSSFQHHHMVFFVTGFGRFLRWFKVCAVCLLNFESQSKVRLMVVEYIYSGLLGFLHCSPGFGNF